MSETAVREPSLTASKDAPLGGQAVLEGVMMRGVKHWAVAVRTPAAEDAPEGTLGGIAVEEFEFGERPRLRAFARIPILRGVIALVESLGIGFKALSIAASAQLGEEAEDLPGGIWIAVLVVAFAFAIGLFFVVPVTLVNLVRHQLGSSLVFWLVEGALRTAIFLGYMTLLSRMRDLRRTFEYHGAEHKTISCYEAGDELTPERAALYSRLHPRCGTSFLLVVMIVSIFVFAVAGLHAWWILVITRIVGLPIIIGVSFELIKWAGKNRARRWVQIIMYPGLQLQRLTTREPSLDQLEVAISALNSVLAHETPGSFDPDELVGVEVVA
ncbi:MAG TPA: DUF1385 domain-containing protein [Solirubrobacteraceae bacterium]|jgi:uncharacterized protein YqhQ|nr:DUF1385 domain-containing protein [Solirubrobacteraceae bacterium]